MRIFLSITFPFRMLSKGQHLVTVQTPRRVKSRDSDRTESIDNIDCRNGVGEEVLQDLPPACVDTTSLRPGEFEHNEQITVEHICQADERDVLPAERQANRIFAAEREPDLGLEALGAVASGRLPAIFTAHRADDLLTAIRLGRELGLSLALAGGSEAYLARDAIRRAGVPVLVGPVMERVSAPQTENAS